MNNSGLNNRKYDDHEDPPIQNIPPVKMAASRMKTALDDLDSQGEHVVSDSQEESPVIDEFESQKTSSQDQHAMQTQEDIIDFTRTCCICKLCKRSILEYTSFKQFTTLIEVLYTVENYDV